MTDRHHHLAQIGTFELRFYGRDDRYVKRAVARWLSLFWVRGRDYISTRYPGSMSAATNEGWHDTPPRVTIGRWRLLAGDIIPATRAAIIEDFPISSESIHEFRRVFDRP